MPNGFVSIDFTTEPGSMALTPEAVRMAFAAANRTAADFAPLIGVPTLRLQAFAAGNVKALSEVELWGLKVCLSKVFAFTPYPGAPIGVCFARFSARPWWDPSFGGDMRPPGVWRTPMAQFRARLAP
jgi:hypothetical protein